jgi:hypothetical protein
MKKKLSNRPVVALAERLCAKPSELLELLDLSRSYLHRISTGERPLNGRVLEKITRLQLKDTKTSTKIPSAKPISKKFCEQKSGVAQKKMNDLQDALQNLHATQEAMAYIGRLIDKLPPQSLEYDWCKMHQRRLSHRLPKQTEEQRAEWEAQLAGLIAEKSYWEKRIQGF